MLRYLLILISFFLFQFKAISSEYSIDDTLIDNLFDNVSNVESTENCLFFESSVYTHKPEKLNSGDVPIIAFLLALFLGNLGIHRIYLGTSTGTIVGYILTCGGCGIVSFVDMIILFVGIISDDVSRYVDNPQFLMW
jgi:hypothetical protein